MTCRQAAELVAALSEPVKLSDGRTAAQSSAWYARRALRGVPTDEPDDRMALALFDGETLPEVHA